MIGMIGSGGYSPSMMSGMEGMRPSQEEMSKKFQERFVQDFGDEALASIQNEDGTINMDKLGSFMASKDVEKPSSPPPMMGGLGDPSGKVDGEIDTEALLEQLKSDFGEEAATEVTNEDGSLSFEKLVTFLDGKMGQASMPPPPPPGGMDEESLLEKLAADFGDEAVGGITNDDGSINHDNLKNFLDEKIAAGEIPAPSTSASESSNFDLADVLGSIGNQYGSQSYLLENLIDSDGNANKSLFNAYS